LWGWQCDIVRHIGVGSSAGTRALGAEAMGQATRCHVKVTRNGSLRQSETLEPENDRRRDGGREKTPGGPIELDLRDEEENTNGGSMAVECNRRCLGESRISHGASASASSTRCMSRTGPEVWEESTSAGPDTLSARATRKLERRHIPPRRERTGKRYAQGRLKAAVKFLKKY